MNAPLQASPTVPTRADVIVIGGGIMGTSTAFFLRRRNRSVILLERGLTGQQASGVNFGGIRRQGRALPQLAMANRAKAFSRVGMGRCQGRYCAHAGAEVIAAAASVPLASVGRLRGQAPVKPLPMALVEEASE